GARWGHARPRRRPATNSRRASKPTTTRHCNSTQKICSPPNSTGDKSAKVGKSEAISEGKCFETEGGGRVWIHVRQVKEQNCRNREDQVASKNPQDRPHRHSLLHGIHFELSTNVLPSMSLTMAAEPQSAFWVFVTTSTPLLSSSRTVRSTSSVQKVTFIFVPG